MGAPNPTALQKRILKYWMLAFAALMASTLIAMMVTVAASFALGIDYYAEGNDLNITIATLGLSLVLWLPVLFWARQRTRFAECGHAQLPLFWAAHYDLPGGRWLLSVPTRCPRCGAGEA